MSRIAAIADAVKTALNDGDFSQEFTAERVYVAISKLDVLDALRVVIVPSARDISLLGRNQKQSDVQIDVGILKRVSQECDPTTQAGNEELDPLLLLAEEIAESFEPGDYGGGRWQGITQVPLFDTPRLLNEKVFQTVVPISFKLY